MSIAILAPEKLMAGRDEYVGRLPEWVRQASELIAYCEVGVRVSLFALLHEVHMGKTVPVFDGSLMQ